MKIGSVSDGSKMTMSDQRLPVALVQRSIPHYRVPLFRKLARDERFSWTFYCDVHDQSSNSGLAAPLEGLPTRSIWQRNLGKLVIQTGIPVSSEMHRAIMVDYGWTILSNPLLFWRARSRGVATIGWSKGVSQDLKRKKHPLRRVFERASVSLCDALVVYGNTSRDYFVNLGFPPERIFVAQNTIDTRRIACERQASREGARALRDSLGVDGRPLVGFLGKIGPAKRVDRLVAAFELARDKGTDAQLLVAGRGPDAEAVEALMASSRHAAHMRRLPDVPPGNEGAVFQAIDVYASYAEAGLGVLEAMAHAVPVVTTPERYPETELLTDGETAFLSTEASVESLANAMVRALSDSAARHGVAIRAQALVLERATLEAMVGSICAAVETAIDHRTSRRHVTPRDSRRSRPSNKEKL